MKNSCDVLEREIKVSTKMHGVDDSTEWMDEIIRQNRLAYSLNGLNLENQPAKPRECNVYMDIADEGKSRVPKEWINKLRNLAENLSSMSREIMDMIDSTEQKAEADGMTVVRM